MSSTTYAVEIPKSIEDEVSSWDLHPSLEIQLYESIRDELGEMPDDQFHQVAVAPVRFADHSILVNHPQTGTAHRFFLKVNIWQEPGTRVVTYITYLV